MILEFEQVTGKGKDFYLQDISFSVEAGYLIGLAGKNGAGKTTLLNYILDEKKQYEGSIRLMGEEIHRCHEKTLDRIGFVSEDNQFLMRSSVEDNAMLYGSFYSNWSKELFIENVKRMKVPMYQSVGALSRGEYMKFQMAFAMAHKPVLYILDEATAGMDPIFRKEFFRILSEVIREEEASVLMTTHSVEELEKRMDYVGIMEKGRLLSFEESGEMEWKS